MPPCVRPPHCPSIPIIADCAPHHAGQLHFSLSPPQTKPTGAIWRTEPRRSHSGVRFDSFPRPPQFRFDGIRRAQKQVRMAIGCDCRSRVLSPPPRAQLEAAGPRWPRIERRACHTVFPENLQNLRCTLARSVVERKRHRPTVAWPSPYRAPEHRSRTPADRPRHERRCRLG